MKKPKKAKKIEVEKKTAGPLFGKEAISKKLQGWKTTVQLATELEITKTTAQNYIKGLQKSRKVETKKTRQGKRGPLAIAYRVP